jgi:hypothetical protein
MHDFPFIKKFLNDIIGNRRKMNNSGIDARDSASTDCVCKDNATNGSAWRLSITNYTLPGFLFRAGLLKDLITKHNNLQGKRFHA